MIPFDPSRPQNLTHCIASEPRLQKLIKEDSRVKKLTDLSLKLEVINRYVATHAAGVVIAVKKLSEIVPLYKDASSDLLLPSTQFDMYSAENAGLIKFDFPIKGFEKLTIDFSFVFSFNNNADWIWILDPLDGTKDCLLYTSPSPRDRTRSRMPSSA